MPVAGVTLILAASLALMFGAIPAAAEVPEAPQLPALERAEAAVRAVRGGLEAGGLAGPIRGAAESLGVALVPGAAPVIDPPPGTPGPIAPTVGRLLGAVSLAGEQARRALLVEPAALEGAAARATELLDRALANPRDLSLMGEGERFVARIPSLVDRSTLFSGALALATAIDDGLPALRSYAASLPATGSAAGCEVVDQAGVLCIGGTGANTITGDYALVIDLGGDDVHRNSAGGASVLVNGLAASVTIDLGGDDVYAVTPGEDTPSMGAQGAARTGGIGVLVDAAGDDSYSIASTKPEASQVLGQGAAVAGVGVLADLGGDDDYGITNTVPSSATHSQGQGFSAIGGMGVFLDAGLGDDLILDRADPPPFTDGEGNLVTSRTRVECCANAAGGSAAVYADDGGADRTVMEAVSDSAGDDPAPDQAVAAGHGSGGLGGVAVSITGTGPTERMIRASSTAPRASQATAAGLGGSALGGVVSAFIDAGGDDASVVEALSSGRHEAIVTDECRCEESVVATSSAAYVSGGGFGALGAVGLAEDGGGSDRYLFSASPTAIATVRDERTAPGAAPPEATAEAQTARSSSLGYGAAAGLGSFLDAAGDDRYESRSVSDAAATVVTTDGGIAGRAVAQSDLASSETLGAAFGDLSGAAPGAGEFRDLGGADAYAVVNRAGATADPPTVTFAGEAMSSAAGSVVQNSIATFLDQGGTETFAIVPPDPACQGERGSGTWQDCGTLLGAGVNT